MSNSKYQYFFPNSLEKNFPKMNFLIFLNKKIFQSLNF